MNRVGRPPVSRRDPTSLRDTELHPAPRLGLGARERVGFGIDRREVGQRRVADPGGPGARNQAAATRRRRRYNRRGATGKEQ